MPTKMLCAAAGLVLLLTASLGSNANATTLPPVGTLPAASPVQNIACWCGPYRCACRHRYWGPRYYGYYGPRHYGYYGPRYYGWRRPGVGVYVGPRRRWWY
jgi:hypothetical protein